MEWGWVIILGLLIWATFRAGRQTERDEMKELKRKREQENIDLGSIAPIAAMMVLGKITPDQAENEVRRSAVISRTVVELWRSMSKDEREELGWNFVKISMDPAFQAKQREWVDALKELDPESWRKSDEAVRRSLASSNGSNL